MTDIVLHYHDVVIRKADFDTLREGQWLNDTIIEFYMEYIERELVPKDINYLFLRPGITHLIKFASEDVMDLIPALPPNMDQRQVVFIPINDGNATQAYSGSHWSLMVYVKAMNTFYYYDSLQSSNRRQAEYTGRRTQPLLRVDREPQFISMNTPQQKNGSDCGVYVIAIIDTLLHQLLRHDKEMYVKEEDVSLPKQVRQTMIGIIESNK
ncbi:cysteine proteinase [Backusella circina FSU 941]|nr:cysteine proteinase [Backusella circina FSU 941]